MPNIPFPLEAKHNRKKVHCRRPEDVYNEMRDKWDRFGIRDFALYADYLLWKPKENIMPLLESIAATKDVFFRMHAPEGLDVRMLSQSQRLVDLLKEAHFNKIYLPCESIDDNYTETLNRNHVQLDHFVQAIEMCEKAGFSLRNMDVNAFVLYGLPGESIDKIVKTILFVSEIVGAITPMLFTPVPTTKIFQEHLSFIKERGWDKDIQMLNGKLYPFLDLNEGTVKDYVDIQRLMYALNTKYRGESFQLFGNSKVSKLLRENFKKWF